MISPPAGGQNPVKLRIDNLYLCFGGMMALGGVSFDVKEGEILAVIGPNGAGKTCTLNCVNGFYRPQRGEIFYEGRRITLNPPHRIVKRINSEERTSILLVEQNAIAALSVAEYGYVMENGKVVLDGPTVQLKDNEDIKEFYLGLSEVGLRKSYREVKHYKRRKRWLG